VEHYKIISKNMASAEIEKEKQKKLESLFFEGELSPKTPTCDLHGLTPDEAVGRCDTFINHEFMKGTRVVKIIHGRGEGKLRKIIHDFLRDNELVEDFRDAQSPSSVGGVTITILVERE
jgi:DNA mismatch repair protein MutS2